MRYLADAPYAHLDPAITDFVSFDDLRFGYDSAFGETTPGALQRAAEKADRIMTDATDITGVLSSVLGGTEDFEGRGSGVLEPLLPYLVSWIRCMANLDELWCDEV